MKIRVKRSENEICESNDMRDSRDSKESKDKTDSRFLLKSFPRKESIIRVE